VIRNANFQHKSFPQISTTNPHAQMSNPHPPTQISNTNPLQRSPAGTLLGSPLSGQPFAAPLRRASEQNGFIPKILRPVHYAAKGRNVEIVRQLLECRANPEDAIGITCCHGDDRVLEELLKFQVRGDRHNLLPRRRSSAGGTAQVSGNFDSEGRILVLAASTNSPHSFEKKIREKFSR
jgi:hypothetical protein